MLSAASCNKWWLEDIMGTDAYEKEQADITKLGENKVFFLPYLMGERSPHNNPQARGTFIGMSMDTSRSDMTQAVLEGVGFALRDSLEVANKLGITVKKTKICGGGAKSALWRKMIANILNLEVEVLESEQGPGLGAAMLAMVACGEYSSVEEAVDAIVKVKSVEYPDKSLVAKYDERYNVFREIYPACVHVFSML
jgi:xylulokinase